MRWALMINSRVVNKNIKAAKEFSRIIERLDHGPFIRYIQWGHKHPTSVFIAETTGNFVKYISVVNIAHDDARAFVQKSLSDCKSNPLRSASHKYSLTVMLFHRNALPDSHG